MIMQSGRSIVQVSICAKIYYCIYNKEQSVVSSIKYIIITHIKKIRTIKIPIYYLE